MSTSIGIRNSCRLSANQAVAASVVLVTLGLTTNAFAIPLAALQRVHVKLHLWFTLGATGGFKFQLTSPAAPGNAQQSFIAQDTVTPAQIVGQAATLASIANALAVAGTHFIDIEADYVNGVNAGSLLFQFACNSAANSITVLQGSWMDVVFV